MFNLHIVVGQVKKEPYSCANVNLDSADDCRLRLSESFEFKKQIEQIQKIRDQAVANYHTLSTSKLPTSKSKTDVHKKTKVPTHKVVHDSKAKEMEQLREKHKTELEKLQKERNEEKRKEQKAKDALLKEKQKLKTEQEQFALKCQELEKEKQEEKKIYEEKVLELMKVNKKLQFENKELKEVQDKGKEILLEKKRLLKELLDKFDAIK